MLALVLPVGGLRLVPLPLRSQVSLPALSQHLLPPATVPSGGQQPHRSGMHQLLHMLRDQSRVRALMAHLALPDLTLRRPPAALRLLTLALTSSNSNKGHPGCHDLLPLPHHTLLPMALAALNQQHRTLPLLITMITIQGTRELLLITPPTPPRRRHSNNLVIRMVLGVMQARRAAGGHHSRPTRTLKLARAEVRLPLRSATLGPIPLAITRKRRILYCDFRSPI